MVTSQEPQLDLESGGGGGGGSTAIAVLVPQEVVDLGNGGADEFENREGNKVILLKVDKDCRICHLSFDVNSQESGNGIAIELGCSCKNDLAVAHKECAEAWFKIKGNRTCEICGSTARNIAGADEDELIDQWHEQNGDIPSRATASGETMATTQAHTFWKGHRFLNVLLASMVFAFVISWLFHFNVPS